jgi:Transposase DDE domain group 1
VKSDTQSLFGLSAANWTLATPEPMSDWSLTTLKERLIKIGAKVVSHGRYIAFQMAEVAIPRHMFQEILHLIAELRPKRCSCSSSSRRARSPSARTMPRIACRSRELSPTTASVCSR